MKGLRLMAGVPVLAEYRLLTWHGARRGAVLIGAPAPMLARLLPMRLAAVPPPEGPRPVVREGLLYR